MPYAFQIGRPVEQELRRIAAELIDHSLRWSEPASGDRHEAVHEVRKDCKRLRGLLRLVRMASPELYDHENAIFKDIARRLSTLRDAEAAIETYDALMDRFGADVDRPWMGPIRRALTLRREALAEDEGTLEERLAVCRRMMEDARGRVRAWEIKPRRATASGFDLIGGGLEKTYARGRRAMAHACAAPSVEAFHEWRKRAKYLRYQLRVLQPAWPALLKPAREEAKRLSDLLGDDHDLAVLEEILPTALDVDASPARSKVFRSLIASRRTELREGARALGGKLYAEKPARFRQRICAYWEVAEAT